ncbi:MAG: substrate-binding domain-containing protein, partial [Acidimicrobiia bacterium]
MSSGRPALYFFSLLALAACAGSAGEAAATVGTGSDGELLVSAAASLTDAFAEVATVLEAANPGVDVILNLAGSSALREQILEGAPVDVFA